MAARRRTLLVRTAAGNLAEWANEPVFTGGASLRQRLACRPLSSCGKGRGRLALLFCATVAAGCGVTEQVRYETDHTNLTLARRSRAARHRVPHPAAATGREADKQALAHAFARELQLARPG